MTASVVLLILTVLAADPVYTMSEQELDGYIRAQAAQSQDFPERLRQIVLDTVGTPYHDGPLGEGPKGTHDTDPLVDFSRADCVTYVEQTIATAAAKSYDDMFTRLQHIRYKDGEVDYEPRNHFFISDWTVNNEFCTDVTRDLGVPTKAVTRTISRRGFFDLVKAPEFGRDTSDREVTLHVIAPEHVAAVVKAIPDPSLVVFVGKVDWLFALHCGLQIKNDAGEGLLYHASSKAGKVVGMDLAEYVKAQGDRYVGIAVFRIDEPQD